MEFNDKFILAQMKFEIHVYFFTIYICTNFFEDPSYTDYKLFCTKMNSSFNFNFL